MKYSIITPVYNRADCIARCLDSVIRNLRWGVELENIVVDDGSHDDSPKIVQNYADKHPHIKFIPFLQNRGTNAARNAAIAAATGDYCIILDSDDYFVDEAVRQIDGVVTTHKYLHYFFMPDDMIDFHNSYSLIQGKECAVITYEDLLLRRVDGDFIHVVSTNIFKKYPFDEYVRVNEGVFFMLLHREEKEIYYSNIVTTIRERGREDSVSRSTRADKEAVMRSIKAINLRLKWFESDLLKYPEGVKLVSTLLLKLVDYNLIIGDYKNTGIARQHLKQIGCNEIPFLLLVIYKLKLSWFYYLAGMCYSKIK